MAITVGTTTTADTAGGTLVINKPTVAVGDVMVACVAANGTTVVPPSGWVQIFASTTFNPRLWVGRRTVDGTEGSSFTWTAGVVAMSGCITPFTGVDNVTPEDVTATTYEANDTLAATVLLPTLTPVTSGCALVAAAACNSATVTSSPPTSPGTFIEQFDSGVGGVGKAASLDTLIYDSLSATGTVTVTQSAARARNGALVALRPAVAAGSVVRSARPGRTWEQRFHHPQKLPSTSQVADPGLGTPERPHRKGSRFLQPPRGTYSR